MTDVVGGKSLKDWKCEEICDFDKINVTLTFDFVKESTEFKEGEVSKALVSSSLFNIDQDQYYNEVVTNIINEITSD